MAGTINSLGLGSGTLTSDVIDKLKKADQGRTVKPLEIKIKENTTRTSDLNTIRKMADELKSLSHALSGEMGYLGRNTNLSGSSAQVIAQAGTSAQSFTIDVEQLAQKQITQSTKTFGSDSSALGFKGDVVIEVDGEEKTISITEDMSLKDIKDTIYEQSGENIVASALNVGKDADGKDQFKLVLRSKNDGDKGAFSIKSGTNGILDNLGLVDIKDADGNVTTSMTVQKAQNAKFKYNGVEVSRSSNKFDDLVIGITIKLQNTGKTEVDIKQDTKTVVENVEKFVEKYNELVKNLDTVTGFDSEKKVKGTFQGNSEMNSIFRQIKDSLITTNGAMADFGIELNRHGELTLDKAKLENVAKTDFDSLKTFFQGTPADESKGTRGEIGMFTSVTKTLDSITSHKRGGLFKAIETDLKENGKRLQKNLLSSKKSLDNKYDIMMKQFAAYDAMIAKMNASFASMKMMIQQSISTK